jgi:hypothetical protein
MSEPMHLNFRPVADTGRAFREFFKTPDASERASWAGRNRIAVGNILLSKMNIRNKPLKY